MRKYGEWGMEILNSCRCFSWGRRDENFESKKRKKREKCKNELDKERGWKYQIHGEGTLEVELLFGFQIQLFGVTQNLKEMFTALEYD